MAEYIELDAVMQKFADRVKPSNNSDFVSVPTWNEAVQIVEDFPAADVRPVVRGKWLDRSSGWTFNSECNKCGFIVHEQFIKTYKYCPNCGADMRGEKDV